VPPVVEVVDAIPAGTAALAILIAQARDGDRDHARASRAHEAVAREFGLDLSTLRASIDREQFTGKVGEVLALPVGDRLLLAVGTGDGSTRDLRRAGAAIARRVKHIDNVAIALARGRSADQARALAEGLLLGGYSFKITNNPKPEKLTTIRIVIDHPGQVARAVEAGVVTARASMLARDLANTPSSTKTPAWLARQAQTLAKRHGLDVTVRDERRLKAEGFGGIVAVGQGSVHPPRLIELSYSPRDPLPGHVVLVGKGITFDSGGLSLKQTAGMVAMKTDMAAGGAVIATMSALRDLGVRVRVTGLVPAAENMPSGSAQRPSDVITHYGGTTVEVLNTDAEGRLVLADALAYADANLDPDVVIDLATLTGAITQGLGRRHAGLFATNDVLAAALERAGAASGEAVWRMPLTDDYRDALESPVADLTNVATAQRAGYKAGAIIAALFLREFVAGRRWAHLDIAGVGRADADEHEIMKGPTGYGVRLLLHWLAAGDPLRGLR
jgi:leucyl aminopeptidase